MCLRKLALFWLALPVYFSSGSLSAQGAVELTPCEKTMQELRTIIPQVKQHCRTLEKQLSDCQTNYARLQVSLATSSANAMQLQSMLDASRQKLDELEASQATSASALTELREALVQSSAALTSLRSSLELYRLKSEGTIKALSAWAWLGPAVGAAVVVVVWVAVSLTR